MRFIFIVQGEGRGHITQAISLFQMLKRNNHEVVKVMVGSEKGNHIPQLIKNQIDVPIIGIASPSLYYNSKTCKLSVLKTVLGVFINFVGFVKSLFKIKREIEASKADVIINFYDSLGGIYNGLLNKSRVPFVCIAHQYLLQDATFPHEKKYVLDKILVNLNSSLTSIKADKILTLSFRPLVTKNPNLIIIPPLLRSDIHQLKPTTSDFILVYLSRVALLPQIIDWHKQHPATILQCFGDFDQTNEKVELTKNLFLNKPNNTLFLEMMAQCKGLVTTAGFEAVSEAMYLQKPVFMTPMPGHYEQYCNAIDGELSGAGIRSNRFDLSRFLNYVDLYKPTGFTEWQKKSDEIIVTALETIEPRPIRKRNRFTFNNNLLRRFDLKQSLQTLEKQVSLNH